MNPLNNYRRRMIRHGGNGVSGGKNKVHVTGVCGDEWGKRTVLHVWG